MADDRIGPALTAPLASLGLVLDDLTVVPAGRRRVVRVLVDRDLSGLAPDDTDSPVAPLTLDEVADATRVVGAVLDGEYDGPGAAGDGVDLMGSQPYTLEVSSPGLDRPLRGARAFRRNVGRLVALTLADGSSLTARVLSVTGGGDDARAQVEVPGTKKTPATRHEVALADVTSARVQVEFTRPGDAGAPYGPDGPDGQDEQDEQDDEKEDDGGH
ncbi:ribosome maturation factor RimP [Lapillicoccus jejuensis]|uniref:Ribosome maturation factor RimP n=1 Tax=Lapillicoccus jejuensis TaxID=402171 RepID=A0A542E3V7_9MICO|nr:ribosome maturation factor RimP [Lapillicoccus jejuensis]TQJ09966.1 ribosome maturation factor RimP [Lapillicoccus jejuensis]